MYQQQVWFWSSKQKNCCPWTKWLQDLQQRIGQWQEDGNFIVLLADMNDDVSSKDLHKFCQDLNLAEAISSLYGQYPVPTHQQGSKAINRIYVSQALLEHAEGGILALGTVTPSDHQAIWLDIKVTAVAMDQEDQVVCHSC